MLRYELEKELISGTLEVDDLKEAWNEKMVSYLGIKPEDDAQGVLQDVHWADGLLVIFRRMHWERHMRLRYRMPFQKW